MEVSFNKKTVNPFYGLRDCLSLYQNIDKTINSSMLNLAWQEVKDSKEKRQMFFSLLFSVGDITARQHNIFKGNKVNTGGSAQRKNFMIIVDWLMQNHYTQFKRFMFSSLFNEYTSFDTLLMNRIETQPKVKKNIRPISKSVLNKDFYIKDLVEYCKSIIEGNNENDKKLLAKFLSRPRTSKRSKHSRILPDTLKLMLYKVEFYTHLSNSLGFPYYTTHGFTVFTGLNEWRQKYIQNNEAYLFSSGKIKDFDKQEFLQWLESLPSSARYRVKCRLITDKNTIKPKWDKTELGKWYLKWQKFKETKQKEVRIVEEKVRQGIATEKEISTLDTVKKEAKVTVGAVNFKDMFVECLLGTVDSIKIQPFLDKVKLDYNNLIFIDDSGSMQSKVNAGFSAFDLAHFMATIFLMKNPDDEARNLIGYFSSETRLFNYMDKQAYSENSILRSKSVKTLNKPLYNPQEDFMTNLSNLRNFGHSVKTYNGTNIATIPQNIHEWTQGDSDKIEQIQKYPVWTIVSDGNWNQLPSPEASLNDFMRQCEKYFGFKPFIIAIDVSNHSANIERFSGIDNFMFVNANPVQIEQILTNFKDINIMDIYTPLDTLYKSNRYDLVRNATI